MSGPWDRPTSPERESTSPEEDSGGPARAPLDDPWPSDDLWGRPPAAEPSASSWDAWAPSPTPEESLPDDAELPFSDPWAESWTDEAAPPPAPPVDRWSTDLEEPIAPAGADVETPRDPWGPVADDRAPAPREEPWRSEPWSPWPAEPTPIEPIASAPTSEPPVLEPSWTEPPVSEPPVSEPPMSQPPMTEPPVDEPPMSEPHVLEEPPAPPPAEVRPAALPSTPWAPAATDPWTTFLEDVRSTSTVEPPPAEAPPAEAPVVQPETEPQPELERETESQPEPEPEPEPEPQPELEPEPDAQPASEPEPDPESKVELTSPTAAQIDVDGDVENEIESIPAHRVPVDADSWAAAAAIPAIRKPSPGAEAAVDDPALTAPDRGSAPGGPQGGANLGEQPSSEGPPWAAAPMADQPVEQPALDAAPDEVGWTDRPDATQVLPAGWADTERRPTEPDRPLRPRTGELEPQVGPIRVSLADAQPDSMAETELEEGPSTAEQAVPWLIGVILLLAGMVIVLMALIFLGDSSLGGGGGGASPEADRLGGVLMSGSPEATASATQTPQPSASRAPASAAAEPTTTPLALPEYGPLEMIYQGRSAALAPIYLLHDDFTTTDEAEILAQDAELDVRRFAWAPDGTVGAGLLSDLLVSIEPGAEKRPLGRGIATITFGDDAETLYAVRVTEDGANDVATVLQIAFVSGDATELGSVTYPRPTAPGGDSLVEAQSADDGGPVRLLWLENDILRLWVIGAGQWDVAPGEGDLTPLDADAPPPTLWAPDGDQHIVVSRDGSGSVLRVLDDEETELLATRIEGRVSHVRWSPSGERVVFTVGSLAPNGGIIQDLFLWDINEEGPMKLTTSGANFGPEWRGTQPLWRP